MLLTVTRTREVTKCIGDVDPKDSRVSECYVLTGDVASQETLRALMNESAPSTYHEPAMTNIPTLVHTVSAGIWEAASQAFVFEAFFQSMMRL